MSVFYRLFEGLPDMRFPVVGGKNHTVAENLERYLVSFRDLTGAKTGKKSIPRFSPVHIIIRHFK